MSLRQFVTIAFLALSTLACGFNNGVEWSELSFTRHEPRRVDLVGTWHPTPATLEDMRTTGGYAISTHSLILRKDGSFSMTNMPDWWSSESGESGHKFESGSGSWKLSPGSGPFAHWELALDFGHFIHLINISRQSPPYLICIYVGDPDSGQHMLFEREHRGA